ncbi:MAG TPA: hypothetical protein VMV93_12050 [Chloroflexota bacterium]|nr:hypothetical protein [Chloroflexota bacterium]
MWTTPAVARAIRQQALVQRRRNFVFTPAPLPRSASRPATQDDRDFRLQHEPSELAVGDRLAN